MLDPKEPRGYRTSLDPLTVQLNPGLAETERRMFRLERMEASIRKMITDTELGLFRPINKEMILARLECILYEERP